MEPQATLQIQCVARAQLIQKTWLALPDLRIDKFAILVVSAGLELFFDSIAQTPSSPCSYTAGLVQVGGGGRMPPQSLLLLLSLSAALRLAEGVLGIGRDVVEDEVLVVGGIADFERARLLSGEERVDSIL